MLASFRTPNIRERNVGLLKQYAEGCYKLIHLESVRIAGYEEIAPAEQDGEKERRGTVNPSKLHNSLSRSRGRVFELALCNPWEYFCTFTIDASKHDRYDLDATYKQFAKWLNNYNSRRHTAIRYLLVPEPHQDGAWHFHGLLLGLPDSHLTPFTLGDKLPLRIKQMLAAGRQLYNWTPYAEAFGFVTLDAIRDKDACAAYMTKYITKELAQSSIDLNHHVFYASHGLKRAEVIYRGEMKREIVNPDFENDYVHIKQFQTLSEALTYFCDEEDNDGTDSFDG